MSSPAGKFGWEVIEIVKSKSELLEHAVFDWCAAHSVAVVDAVEVEEERKARTFRRALYDTVTC